MGLSETHGGDMIILTIIILIIVINHLYVIYQSVVLYINHSYINIIVMNHSYNVGPPLML